MPKLARQIPPVLELFRIGPGAYSLRLHDTKDNYIAVKLAELIPDLATIQVITPVDMKIFRFDGEDVPERVNGKINGKLINTSPEINSDEETPDPMDAAMELADEAEVEAAPAKRLPGRPKKSKSERSDKCGRCRGVGKVQQLMEGGSSTEAACPVCQGEGVITRFGMQR